MSCFTVHLLMRRPLLLKKSATVVSHWCFHCMKTVASSDSGIVGKASGRLVTSD